ncbi:MAG: UDP-N-acetylmuramate dehydrogenase [Gammaproteobacteria bacterium]
MGETITFRGQLLHEEPMSKHTSWRVGGNAERYYIPSDMSDLQVYLAALDPDTPVTWVGLGSNMLVRDGGIRGDVIAPLNALDRLELLDNGRIYAECGVTNMKLAKLCLKHELTGGEFLAGVPGTVGGALTMNAGAFGSETWSHVERVTMIDRQGRLIDRDPSEFSIAYRSVSCPDDEWFASALFHFTARQAGQESGVRQLLLQRNASQPIGQPSCGSVFKNPRGDHAARLIESAGMKGHCQGGACVSEKHANFIISKPQTSASDIEALIGLIQQTVRQKFDVVLETEVRIVGEAS